MPFILQTLVGRREKLVIFGNDWDTHDGYAIRDFIHVVDLAEGHLKALEWVDRQREKGQSADGKEEEGKPGPLCNVFNLGTGKGHSVKEVVEAMEKASGRECKKEVGGRREGDLACLFAATDKAEKELKWKAKLGLKEMCEDSWRWQQNNPYGYRSKEEVERLEKGK
ncbi:UGE5 [Symbiodinium sp. KB8]|nr:UGE5 [Symbiodinium sp. KB8]